MYFGPAYTVIDALRLASDAQKVVTLRMQGMAGLRGGWSDTQTETSRMIAEKPACFFRAWAAANEAACRGKTPDAVLRAYLAPLTATAADNRARLSGRDSAVVL